MMAGIIGDSFFHLPDPLVFALLGMALVFMFTGVRTLRRQKRGEPAVPLDQRHKRFGILFVSLLAGFAAGYFLIRHDHPEFSVAFSILLCVLGLLFATGIIVWQIYRPRKGKT
jgi:phosphatidylglycerophosphate synthase